MEHEEHIIPITVERSDNTNSLNRSLITLSIREPEIPQQENSGTNISLNDKVEHIIAKNVPKTFLPVRQIPTHNVHEKIMICLDTCADPEFTAFKLGDGSKFSPLYMLKRTIDIFVKNKHFIDPRHQFALLTCNETSVTWAQEFTNNPQDIINALTDINECEQRDEFDLGMLLETIWQNVTIPKPAKDLSITPPYVVRLILLYSRSYCLPIIRKDFKELLTNPYFTMDIVMTHEESPIDDRCQEIFNILQHLDNKGSSYNFDVGRNPTALHDAMAKLLSHPLQRPPQHYAMYKAVLTDKEE